MLPRSSRVIYDNCEIYGPDDRLLGLCSRGQYDWYLTKGIAEKMDDKSIRLKFVPKFHKDNGVVRTKRQNKCYVCETTEDLVRFHVIPTQYKRLLPATWKAHNSIDVLCLCQDCSSEADSRTQEFIRQLEEEYGVSRSSYVDPRLVTIKGLSRKILANRRNRVDDSKLVDQLSQILGHGPTDEELTTSADAITSTTYMGTRSPAEFIVQKVVADGDDAIRTFISRWKHHFVECMEPADLPEDFHEPK